MPPSLQELTSWHHSHMKQAGLHPPSEWIITLRKDYLILYFISFLRKQGGKTGWGSCQDWEKYGGN